MPPRRTTYQSGRVGMVNIPNVDFPQYKAQAGVFSDLERRLNTVTDFAIKAGTAEAESRAMRNMITDPEVSNLGLESLQGMTPDELNKMIGSPSGNAYFRKTREVGLSTILSNINSSFNTQINETYDTARGNQETPEEFYKSIKAIKDGTVDSLLEFDAGLATSFNAKAGETVASKFAKYNEDYLSTQRTIKKADLYLQLDPEKPLSDFTITTPLESLQSVLDNIDSQVGPLELERSDITNLKGNAQKQFVNSIRDEMLEIQQYLVADDLEAINKAIVSEDLDSLIPLFDKIIARNNPEGDDAYADKNNKLATRGQMIYNIIEDALGDNPTISKERLSKLLLSPIYDNDTKNKIEKLKQEQLDVQLKDLASDAFEYILVNDMEGYNKVQTQYTNLGGDLLNLEQKVAKLLEINDRISGNVDSHKNLLSTMELALTDAEDSELAQEILYDLVKSGNPVSVEKLEREAGIEFRQGTFEPNAMIDFSNTTLNSIMNLNLNSINKKKADFYDTIFPYVPFEMQSIIANHNVPDFKNRDIYKMVEDSGLVSTHNAMDRMMAEFLNDQKIARKNDQPFDSVSWMKTNIVKLPYYTYEEVLEDTYNSKILPSLKTYSLANKKNLAFQRENNVDYSTQIVFNYTGVGIDARAYNVNDLLVTRDDMEPLLSSKDPQQSYKLINDLETKINNAIDNWGDVDAEFAVAIDLGLTDNRVQLTDIIEGLTLSQFEAQADVIIPELQRMLNDIETIKVELRK